VLLLGSKTHACAIAVFMYVLFNRERLLQMASASKVQPRLNCESFGRNHWRTRAMLQSPLTFFP